MKSIQAIAAAQRLPVSRLARDAILGRPIAPPPPAIPAINRAAYADLAQVGNNLNQIARHLNSGSGAAPEVAALHQNIEKLAGALKAIRADLLTGRRE
ncbi:MAG: plasmid mobilization relaxosome protein MobC [Sulfuritalea sp.]|nr:plasmid mobilization relaxosome protein MobC [Sulfuritalea sp.]MDP1984653.1 plasmid mobilization relaxosome protein MobC [Sulfuritalea sp.]